MSQVNRKNYIHDVDLLDHDSVVTKLSLKLNHHGSGQFGLDVSHSGNFDLAKETSNLFFALLLQQLFQSVGSEVVEESFDRFAFFLRWFLVVSIFPRSAANVEVDANIDRNSDVIFGWHLLNWAPKSNGVFRDHDCDGFV
jgi:hypothetical protein